MKTLFKTYIIFIFGLTLQAQSDYEKSYFETKVQDTFQSESIVTYRSLYEYIYEPYGLMDYKVTVVRRIQYLVKDMHAIEQFSTFTKPKDFKKVDITLIKPGGKKTPIYEFYDKYYPADGYEDTDDDEDDQSDESDMIAPEEIGIGDLFDFRVEYTYTTTPKSSLSFNITNGQFIDKNVQLKNYNEFRSLSTNETFLNSSFPTVDKRVRFVIPDDIDFHQKSFNTTQKYEEEKVGSSKAYTLHIHNSPSETSEDFSYSLKSLPAVRHALVETNNSKLKVYPYQFASSEPSKEDIVALGRNLYNNKSYLNRFYYFLKVSHLSKYEYSLRNTYKDDDLNGFFKEFLKAFCKDEKSKLGKLNLLHEYLTNNNDLNAFKIYDLDMAIILGRFCKKIGLPFQMMASLPKYNGNWSEILSPYDIDWGIYINHEGQELFVHYYSEKSNIYRLGGAFSGTDVIIFNPMETETPYQVIQYPEQTEKDDITYTKLLASLDTTYDYNIECSMKYTGSSKYSIKSDINSQFDIDRLRSPEPTQGLYDFSIYDYHEYTGSNAIEFYEEMMRVDSLWSLYFDTYHASRTSSYIYDEYNVYDFKLDSNIFRNDGEVADHDTANYEHRYQFRTNGFIHHTGSDSMLLIDLGRFLTEQYYLSHHEVKNRKSDLYASTKSKYQMQASIEIPEGYKLINLDAFNIDVVTEAGHFKATAKIEGNKIIITTSKAYLFHYLPLSKFDELVKMVNAAETYYYRQLILIK